MACVISAVAALSLSSSASADVVCTVDGSRESELVELRRAVTSARRILGVVAIHTLIGSVWCRSRIGNVGLCR